MAKKFLQSLNDETYEVLSKAAYVRSMSVQRLIEGVVILEWMKKQGFEMNKK